MEQILADTILSAGNSGSTWTCLSGYFHTTFWIGFVLALIGGIVSFFMRSE